MIMSIFLFYLFDNIKKMRTKIFILLFIIFIKVHEFEHDIWMILFFIFILSMFIII